MLFPRTSRHKQSLLTRRSLPPQEQADLWMSLRDRMKGNWVDLTAAEKKAGAYKLFSPGLIRVLPD